MKDRAHPAHAGNSAGVRRFQPHQNSQQRGFSAAGRSHQDGRTGYRQVHIIKNQVGAKAFFDMLRLDHSATSPHSRRLICRNAAAARLDSAAERSTITSVQAKTSGVERVILAR